MLSTSILISAASAMLFHAHAAHGATMTLVRFASETSSLVPTGAPSSHTLPVKREIYGKRVSLALDPNQDLSFSSQTIEKMEREFDEAERDRLIGDWRDHVAKFDPIQTREELEPVTYNSL